MKILLTIIIISVPIVVNGQKEAKTMTSSLNLIDSWYGAEGNFDGMPTIIRGRDRLKNIFETGLYDQRIEIVWEFDNKDNSGLPSKTESELMAKVEDSIVKRLEYDLQSVLVAVFTWNNTRTWFYYTKSAEEFGQRLNDALAEFKSRFPISISTEEDANWDEYKEILKGGGLEMK